MSSTMADASIELLVSDVDGTLVRGNKSISAATVAAVERLRRAGAAFTIVSSRPPIGLRYPRQALHIEQPMAAFNGGSIVDRRGDIIEAVRVPPVVARQCIERLRSEPLETWVYADDRWLVLDGDGEYVPRERRTIASEPTVVDSFEPYLDRVDKIVVAGSDHPRLAALERELAETLSGTARAVRSQLYYIDITALDANKGHALRALAARIGVPLERVAVIGDAPNDLPMLECAALSIAMGQADDEVKQAADCVTESNDDDGVAHAIERYVLPRLSVRGWRG